MHGTNTWKKKKAKKSHSLRANNLMLNDEIVKIIVKNWENKSKSTIKKSAYGWFRFVERQP